MILYNLDNEISKRDYIYAFLLLCVSGNPFFPAVFTEWIFVGFAFIIFLCHMRTISEDEINKVSFRYWFVGFIILFIAQYMFISPVSIPADINFLARLSIAFIIPSILGEKFRYAYLRAITFTAAVSLILFAAYYFSGWHTGIKIGRNYSIMIYNQLLLSDGARNSGMFWEPGAFQGYINLVPLMFFNDLKLLWNQERLSCIILFLALITTFSTTGYVVFMFIIGTALVIKTNNNLLKIVVSVFIVASVIYSFNSFDFIGEKINHDYEIALKVKEGKASWSRFGAAVVDSYEIARSPITGNGFMMDARYPKLGKQMAGSGNGFTGAVNVFGIVVIFFYLLQLYRRAPGESKSDHLIYVVAVVLLLQGEFFLNYPMFWALLFVLYPQHYSESIETEN